MKSRPIIKYVLIGCCIAAAIVYWFAVSLIMLACTPFMPWLSCLLASLAPL